MRSSRPAGGSVAAQCGKPDLMAAIDMVLRQVGNHPEHLQLEDPFRLDRFHTRSIDATMLERPS